MRITRRFTKPDQNVFDSVEWETRRSRITDSEGKVLFEMKDAVVPKQWSQLATDIMVSKYFRRAGVPQCNVDGTPKLDKDGKPVTGPENSVRQIVKRLAGCWRHWGELHNYFDSHKDAEAFSDELCHMLLHQIAAPNSPQWFNTGLNWAYGITGPPRGTGFPIPGQARPTLRLTRTRIHSPTRALYRASMTTWWARAASWICGRAKRGCSSTGPAPARIFPACAERMSRFPAAARAPA